MKTRFVKISKVILGATVLALAFSVSIQSRSSKTTAFDGLAALKNLSSQLVTHARADAGGPMMFGNLFRMFAFMIVGYPDEATWRELNEMTGGDPNNGPPINGMIGFINDLLGDKGIGQLLKQKYSSCSALPSSGSESTSTEDGTLTVTFSEPSSLIPSRYTDAGSNYEKKLSIALGELTVFTYEFDCANQRGLASFNFPENEAQTEIRKIKLVFELVNKAVKADFGMYYNGSDNERAALRLDGSDSGQFDMLFIRVAVGDVGTGYQGSRIAGKGNAVDGNVTVFFQMLNAANLTALAGATGADRTDFVSIDPILSGGSDLVLCLDMKAKSATLNACSDLAIATPNPAEAYPSSGEFSIANLASSSFISAF